MVDQNRHPEGGPTPPRWLAVVMSVGLGAVAALRAVTGGAPPHADPPPPPERDGPPGGLQHPTVLYDHSDANFRWIIGLVIGAMVFAAVVHYVILRFYFSYAAYESDVKRSHYPVAAERPKTLPPEPRLEQINRVEGYEKGNVYLREEEKEKVLNSYGAAGEKYVHIPIDRAMDHLAGKLPARAAPPSEEQARRQNGLVNAGESNSGRMFRGGRRD
ncbi:MAG TPA: hypothetical protein VFW33_02510 [Gemmataceae bacterium]|nr:hypothetical protein [Gemmataceae bacterium]